MTDESFNEKLVGEMFIAYVSNNSVEPSQIANVVRAISRALSVVAYQSFSPATQI